MTVKIIPTEIGIKKAIEVKESNKNIRATWELQKMMTKLSIDQETVGDSPADFEKVIDMMLDVQTKTINYIVNTLGLDDKQAAKFDEMEFDDTMAFAVRISSELLHIEAQPTDEKETGLED